MCGRYYIADEDSAAELHEILEQLNLKGFAVKTGEISPADTAPVLANNRALVTAPFAMAWGYTMPDGKRMFNARSETASEKPLFRDGMAQRRCLIPATHYFEWEKRGKERIKYAISLEGAATLFMAGIYRIENGKPVFTILTRESAESIQFIHNRMPVILPAEAKNDWLNLHYSARDVLAHAAMDVAFTSAMPSVR